MLTMELTNSEKAKELGADYALFGHTHVHLREKVDGITVLNPGSTTMQDMEIQRDTIS